MVSNMSPLLLLLSLACCISLVACADKYSITCPTTRYDVQYRGYNVTCKLSVSCPSGINFYKVTARQYAGDDLLLTPDIYEFVYVGGGNETQTVTANITFVLLQYQRDGDYTVSAEIACLSAYYATNSIISVASTKNDKAAPVVKSVFVPEVAVGEYTIPVTLTVTDDLVGVQSIYVVVQYLNWPEQSGISMTWNAPANAPRPTNVTTTVMLQHWDALVAGRYDLYIRVTDGIGLVRAYGDACRYESCLTLKTPGLQSTVQIGSSFTIPRLDSILVPPVVKYRQDLTVVVSASDLNGVSAVTLKAYRTDFVITSASYYANDTKISTKRTVQIPVGAPSGFYYVDIILTNGNGVVNTYQNVNNSTGNSVNSTFAANFTLVRSTCLAGRYKPFSAPSSQACTLCPIGTYSDAGEYLCHACAPGFFSTVNGSSACQPCPVGTTGIGGSWACSSCAINYFTDKAGQAACKQCAPGYVRSAGETTCRQCWQGTYTQKGSSDCFDCPAGSYSTDPAGDCQPCPAGTYNPYQGYSQCLKCPANTFSSGGFTQCTPCDGGKKGPAGSNSRLSCYSD